MEDRFGIHLSIGKYSELVDGRSVTSESGPPLPNDRCPYCQGTLPEGARFCSHCGRPLAPVPVQYAGVPLARQIGFRDVLGGIGAYTVLAMFLLVCANIVILAWGIGEVYPQMGHSVTIYVITPFIVDLFQLGGPLFFGFFLFLVAAIVLSFVWMTLKSAKPFGQELMLRFNQARSPLFVIGTLFLALLFFQVAYYLLLAAMNVSTTTPAGLEGTELWKLIFSFAQASVWEEVVSRVLLLGVPLLIFTPIINNLFRPKHPVEQREWWRYFLGGGFKFGPLEMFFLIFSSAMFGFAHLASWDIFKVFPAALAGLAMGYLFLKFGIYASIMFHFFTDYLSVPLSVFPESESLAMILGLLILIFLAVGAVFFVYYLLKGVGYTIGRNLLPERLWGQKRPAVYSAAYYPPSQTPQYPPAPSYPPYQAPPQQAPPPYVPAPQRPQDPTAFGYVCKNCGNTEAIYREGQLICSRCGGRS